MIKLPAAEYFSNDMGVSGFRAKEQSVYVNPEHVVMVENQFGIWNKDDEVALVHLTGGERVQVFGTPQEIVKLLGGAS